MNRLRASAGGGSFLAPVGAKVLLIGDSIIQFADRSSSGNPLATQVDSEFAWANAILGERLQHILLAGSATRPEDGWANSTGAAGANQGRAGSEPSDWTGIIGDILDRARALDVRVVICGLGTNGGVGVSAATHIANLTAIKDAVLLRGMKLIFITVRPRTFAATEAEGYTSTDVRWDRLYDVNTWIRAQSSPPNVVVADPYDALKTASPTTQDGEAKQGVTIDDVHLSPWGARLGGTALASAIAQVTVSGSWLPSLSDALNLAPNKDFAGTGGSVTAPVTGTVGTGWSVSRSTGTIITAVASKPSENVQRIVVTSGAGTNAGEVLRIAHSPTSAIHSIISADPANTWYRLGFQVSANAWDGWAHFTAEIYDSAATQSSRGLESIGGATPYSAGGPREAFSGIVLTPPFQRSAHTSIRGRLDVGVLVGNHPVFGTAISGTGTIDITGVWLVRVPNPATEMIP